MKFAIKDNGYYSHYGTDGKIDFNDAWNKNNEPSKFHYWDSEKQDFILDEDLYKEDLKAKLLDTIFKILDLLKLKSLDNFSYSYEQEAYENKKAILLTDIEANRALIATIAELTIDEIKALQLDKNSELSILDESLQSNIFYKQYKLNNG